MKRIVSVGMTMPLLFSSCVSVGHQSQAAKGIKNADTICIVPHPQTREGFQRAMEAWLEHYTYHVNVLPVGSNVSDCEWSRTYSGKWSWDGAIYLADADITAFQNGIQVGKAEFNVKGGGWNINPKKYGSADTRIQEMMNRLFEL